MATSTNKPVSPATRAYLLCASVHAMLCNVDSYSESAGKYRDVQRAAISDSDFAYARSIVKPYTHASVVTFDGLVLFTHTYFPKVEAFIKSISTPHYILLSDCALEGCLLDSTNEDAVKVASFASTLRHNPNDTFVEHSKEFNYRIVTLNTIVVRNGTTRIISKEDFEARSQVKTTHTLASASSTEQGIEVAIYSNPSAVAFNCDDERVYALVPHLRGIRDSQTGSCCADSVLSIILPHLFDRVSHLFSIYEFTKDTADWHAYQVALKALPSSDIIDDLTPSLGSFYWGKLHSNAPVYTCAVLCDKTGVVQSVHKSRSSAFKQQAKQPKLVDSFVAFLSVRPECGSVITPSFTSIGLTTTEFRAATDVDQQAMLYQTRDYRVAMMKPERGGAIHTFALSLFKATISPFIL